jgi:hypothetical protein
MAPLTLSPWGTLALVGRNFPETGQLCSGRPECPSATTKIRLTQFTFAPDGTITGELDLLPAGSEAVSICSPLTSEFTGLP